MTRQKLALGVNGAPSVSLKRMNGFSPVSTTRLGSATVMIDTSRASLRADPGIAQYAGIRRKAGKCQGVALKPAVVNGLRRPAAHPTDLARSHPAQNIPGRWALSHALRECPERKWAMRARSPVRAAMRAGADPPRSEHGSVPCLERDRAGAGNRVSLRRRAWRGARPPVTRPCHSRRAAARIGPKAGCRRGGGGPAYPGLRE